MRVPRQPFAFAVAACAFAFAAQAAAQNAAGDALTTEKERIGYTIGLDIGKSLKGIREEIDVAAMKRAIDDVFAGRPQVLDDQQAAVVMQAFAVRMKQQTEADQAAALQRNIAAGTAFLAENGRKPDVKTTASGLQYQVLTATKGARPTAESTVRVHYEGKLLDGTVFDSSLARNEPAEFPLSAVIPGWTEALQLMGVGSKYRLWIPAALAYGDQGTPGGPIPPGSTLVFEVELLDVR